MFDLLCFSHLRWDFVYQRPQHLISRFARGRRVVFVEEPQPLPSDAPQARLDTSAVTDLLTVLVPRVVAGASQPEQDAQVQSLLDSYLRIERIPQFVAWYYTPMALNFTRHLVPLATVYDCMDELSGFLGAAPDLLEREAELFARADLVFTGGHSLYKRKRACHPSVHLFPSSVEVEHFNAARNPQPAPLDQISIPRPRLGFFGVLDERFDPDLIANIATLRPDWSIVLAGPTAKIDPAMLPRRENIHYLGSKSYADLPRYLAGWDVALIPFARNEATRFISPTKTPEYLAAGCPVVSTSIADVVNPYAAAGLVRIADDPCEFVQAVELALATDRRAYLERCDRFLRGMSWETTWVAMSSLMEAVVHRRQVSRPLGVAA